MYVPSKFSVTETQRIHSLIKQNPLATLISAVDGKSYVSHIPMTLSRQDSGKLMGHLAMANPHWKMMNGQTVTAIFHGPNAYITPQWYEQNDVPTWNYAVVHVKGTIRLTHDEAELVCILKELTEIVEHEASDPWQFWIPEELSDHKLKKAIVGIELTITETTAKFKLNQNRSTNDRRRVIEALRKRAQNDDLAVAELMEESLKND